LNGKAALATVHLQRPAKDTGAVAITFSGLAQQVKGEPAPWPSMQQDMARRWVVFREQVGVSASEDCALQIASAHKGILAALRYQSGFWIVPSPQCEMQIDSVAVREPVPLSAGITLSIGGSSLTTQHSEQLPVAVDNPGIEARRITG
jgi:hypothetical protein